MCLGGPDIVGKNTAAEASTPRFKSQLPNYQLCYLG